MGQSLLKWKTTLLIENALGNLVQDRGVNGKIVLTKFTDLMISLQ